MMQYTLRNGVAHDRARARRERVRTFDLQVTADQLELASLFESEACRDLESVCLVASATPRDRLVWIAGELGATNKSCTQLLKLAAAQPNLQRRTQLTYAASAQLDSIGAQASTNAPIVELAQHWNIDIDASPLDDELRRYGGITRTRARTPSALLAACGIGCTYARVCRCRAFAATQPDGTSEAALLGAVETALTISLRRTIAVAHDFIEQGDARSASVIAAASRGARAQCRFYLTA
jgi:hypothetical protein